MQTTSYIELSESALRNNIDFLRNIIGSSCTLSSVVKGNAYGHGIEQFVPLAYNCGQRHFSVFSADEAYRVYTVTKGDCTILIMGYIDREDLRWAIEHDIEFFVFDIPRLEAAIETARSMNKPARIHLEIDTGMNRTGLDREEFKQAVRTMRKSMEHLVFEGFCTHLAGAESIANYVRIKEQIKQYNKRYKTLVQKQLLPNTRHAACSAGVMNYARTHFDMVRVGIMQYGLWPSKETFVAYVSRQPHKSDPLQRVISWKSRLMSTHEVKAGEFVGYGTSYLADADMRIGIVPVGYSQGYNRNLSNVGRVLLRGQRVGIVGLVNMNMLLLELTASPDAEPGDEVVLIGEQGDMSVSVSSFSELSSQLNYELLTRLPHNIPRHIIS